MARGVKSKKTGNQVLLLVLGGGCLGLLLFACLITSVGVGYWIYQLDTSTGKLPGTWKGRFEVGTRADVTYIFREDGTFTEENVAPGGGITSQDGRWAVRNGRVEIDLKDGGFEQANIKWIDNNSFSYHIVGHRQLGQIGLKTVFRRI